MGSKRCHDDSVAHSGSMQRHTMRAPGKSVWANSFRAPVCNSPTPQPEACGNHCPAGTPRSPPGPETGPAGRGPPPRVLLPEVVLDLLLHLRLQSPAVHAGVHRRAGPRPPAARGSPKGVREKQTRRRVPKGVRRVSCNPVAETAFQPLIWCSGSFSFHISSFPEEWSQRSRRCPQGRGRPVQAALHVDVQDGRPSTETAISFRARTLDEGAYNRHSVSTIHFAYSLTPVRFREHAHVHTMLKDGSKAASLYSVN